MAAISTINVYNQCFIYAVYLTLSQYDEMSGMGMLLTENQRKWVDMLKDAAKRKAPAQALRPQVTQSILS
jgi:hypothetical protein